MSTRASLRLLAVVATCCLPPVAAAQFTYFPNDATINYTLGNAAYVGKDRFNRNSSPTVNVIDGADLLQTAFVFNGSQLNMSGGRAREGLVGLDSSTIALTGGDVLGALQLGMEGTTPYRGGTILMSGGTAASARVDRGGSLSLHGGTVNGAVTVDHGSTMFLDKSGSVRGGVAAKFDSRVFINGGTVFNGVDATSNASVSITGGKVYDFVHAKVVSTVDISGGTTTFVSAWGSGTVNLSGSNPESLSAHDYGVINMSGGSTGDFNTHNNSKGNLHGGIVSGDVTAFDQSTINIYGGTIGGHIKAYGTVNVYGGYKAATPSFVRLAAAGGLPDLLALDGGLLQLFGSGLTHTLLDPDVSYEGGSIGGSFRRYALSGALLDGSDVGGSFLFVQNGTGADFALINEVPEPGTFALAGLGVAGVALAARRRRRAGRAADILSTVGLDSRSMRT